jgi:hypothetical protein
VTGYNTPFYSLPDLYEYNKYVSSLISLESVDQFVQDMCLLLCSNNIS